MALFDFLKRSRITEVPKAANVATMAPRPAPKPIAPERRTPEDILDEAWSFAPDDASNGKRVFSHQTIDSMAAIASARALMSIADDVEAMLKHMTRLQLVRPAHDEPESVDAVDPHVSSTGTPTPRDGESL